MKVLIINKYLYYKGGAETYALKVGKYCFVIISSK